MGPRPLCTCKFPRSSDPAPLTPTPSDPSPDSAPQQPDPLSGLDEILEDFFFGPDPLGPEDPFGELPGLDELLDEMFGADLVPPELQDILDEMFGFGGTIPESSGGSQ